MRRRRRRKMRKKRKEEYFKEGESGKGKDILREEHVRESSE